MIFKTRLKALREEAGLSQYSFAKQLGQAQSTIGGWEAGVRETNFDMLVKIADFFDVPIDYLLGRTDQREGSAMSKATEAVDSGAELPKAESEPLTAQEIASFRKQLKREGL